MNAPTTRAGVLPYCYVYCERGEEMFAPPDGYRPDDAQALYIRPVTDDTAQTVPLSEYKKLQALVTSQGIRLMEYESGPDDAMLLRVALEALDDACGNRCNAEYNPCYQRVVSGALRKRLGDAANGSQL